MSTPTKYAPLPKYFLPILATIFALAPFAIDAYLPSFPTIAAEFGVDPVQVNFTMSAYLFGFALGQLFGGPISDQIGRKPVGYFGLMMFLLMSLSILASQSLEQLILLRALQAFGGGLAGSVVMPTIRDMSAPEKAASRMAFVFLFMLIAPLIAPAIGVLLLNYGWRFVFVFLCIYSGLVLVGYRFGIKESRNLEIRRPNFVSIFRQYWLVLTHRIDGHQYSVRYGISTAFAGGLMTIYLTNASFIFQTYFALETIWFPILFGINVVFVALAQGLSARYLKKCSLPQIAVYYRRAQRLQLAATGSLLIAVLFFGPPLWLFVLFLALSLGSIGLVSPSGMGLYIAAYNKLSGSASAILTVSMLIIGFAFGALTALFATGNLTPLAVALFSASLIANLLLMTIPKKMENNILERLGNGEIETL